MNRISVFCSAIVLLVVLACGQAATPDAPVTPLPAAAVPTIASAAISQAAQPATPFPAQLAPTVAPLPTPMPTVSAAPTPVSTPTPEPTAVPVLFPYTVIDSLGREVIFEKPPERIVAFDSAPVEILFAIGEGQRVAGTHDFVSYPPEADDVPRVGGAFNMNIEATLALEPDLVFIFFDRFLVDLERAGLKVLYLKTLNQDFTKIADTIRVWGRIVGSPAPADELADDFERRVEKVRETMEPYASAMTVFQDEGGLWTPGQDTLIAEVFELLKFRNIANDVSGYVQLSPEVIVERNPQIIIASYGDTISDNPAFRDVLAVRNKRIFIPSSDALSIAGPRYIDGIEELAKWAYPGIFR
ncbi:MAG: ABC transporter substrate-binding protein [Chloroflexi bacterium]|nr:ABC transporter substrate-binding protein [Chloroflexota bacterium]